MSNVIIKTPYAVSTKADGSMKKSDGSSALSNIKSFLAKKNMPTDVVCMGQVHGSDVAFISDNNKEVIQAVDGLVTTKKGLSLAVVTADCLPILFYDPEKEAIAVAHAGSKGLLKGIVQSTIKTLHTEFGSKPENLIVSVGPSIERDCYEVGTDLVESFEKQFAWFNDSFFKSSAVGHAFLDLRKIALHCLLKEGILEENISISEVCTKHAVDSYYSYRAGDKTDRFVSVISL